MNIEIENRLIELESRVAYQDDALLKMQTLVRAQQQQMYQLEKQFTALKERLQQLQSPSSSERLPNEKPPHY